MKIWKLTDDDCAQYVTPVDQAAGSVGNIFELIQAIEMPDDKYAVSYAIIDTASMDDDDIVSLLHMYGYEGMDDFVQQTSPERISTLPDGSLDKNSPYYIIEWELIAEMAFENEVFENMISRRLFKTFDEAHEWIQEFIKKRGDRIE